MTRIQTGREEENKEANRKFEMKYMVIKIKKSIAETDQMTREKASGLEDGYEGITPKHKDRTEFMEIKLM